METYTIECKASSHDKMVLTQYRKNLDITVIENDVESRIVLDRESTIELVII